MSVASFRGPPRAQAGSVAERVGFEPTVRFPPHTLSKRAPSATRTPLRGKRVHWLTESAAMIDRSLDRVNAGRPERFARKARLALSSLLTAMNPCDRGLHQIT